MPGPLRSGGAVNRIELPSSCLVDTTFLIHLVNAKAEYHANALAYFQALQANQTHFYLPTLVMAEFAVKRKAEGVAAVLSTLNAQVCGFDMSAALGYGKLTERHPTIFNVSVPEKERSVIDLMLVAICESLGIESIITTDKNLCGSFLRDTRINGLDIKRPITELYPLYRQNDADEE